MNSYSRSKSSLFLMELIIVIAFFSLSAAICMKVFSSAKVKADTARDISNASFAAQSLAESYKACGEMDTNLKEIYPYAEEYEGYFTVYFDTDWTQTETHTGVYRITLSEHQDNLVTHAQIMVYDKNNRVLFDMVTAKTNEVKTTKEEAEW